MPDDLLKTTATVLSVVRIWRRAAAGSRPQRYVELRLLVDHPYDDTTHEVEFTIADQRVYRPGQRIEAAVDPRTGEVSIPVPERRTAAPDYRFAAAVLIGVAVLVAVIGAVTFLLGLAQSHQPTPTPGISAPPASTQPTPTHS